MRSTCLSVEEKGITYKKMKQFRLSLTKQHVSCTKDQWNSVIFSDESKFNLYGSDDKWYVRRRKNEEFHPDCISPTVKFPGSQMVWGSISSKGLDVSYLLQELQMPRFTPVSWTSA